MSDERSIEAECIAKFQRKAKFLMKQNRYLTKAGALAQAIALLPKTSARYEAARQLLIRRQIPAAPLMWFED
jgi:hypothetical protein